MIHTQDGNNPRSGIKGLIVLLVLLFLLSGIPLLQAQDKEDEKKKKEKGKSKDEPKTVVITNKDLESDTPDKQKDKPQITKTKTTSSGAAAHQTPAGKSRNKTPVKKKPDPKKTEKYWRDLKAALERNIRDNKGKIQKIESRLNKIRGDFLRSSDTSVSLSLQAEIDQLSKDLTNLKRGLGNLERELAELPDKARREGVPPGWVR